MAGLLSKSKCNIRSYIDGNDKNVPVYDDVYQGGVIILSYRKILEYAFGHVNPSHADNYKRRHVERQLCKRCLEDRKANAVLCVSLQGTASLFYLAKSNLKNKQRIKNKHLVRQRLLYVARAGGYQLGVEEITVTF
jgi:hypothetical protein